MPPLFPHICVFYYWVTSHYSRDPFSWWSYRTLSTWQTWIIQLTSVEWHNCLHPLMIALEKNEGCIIKLRRYPANNADIYFYLLIQKKARCPIYHWKFQLFSLILICALLAIPLKHQQLYHSHSPTLWHAA